MVGIVKLVLLTSAISTFLSQALTVLVSSYKPALSFTYSITCCYDLKEGIKIITDMRNTL